MKNEQKYVENWPDLNPKEQEEYRTSFHQSSSLLLLRVWEEVSMLFIRFLQKAENIPLKKAIASFARKEYQSNKGNVSHVHALLQICLKDYNGEDIDFVRELIRASIYEIVRSEEVNQLIEEKLLESSDEVIEVEHEENFNLSHRCNGRCLVMNDDGTTRCRKINNLKASKDNTRDTFIKLLNNYSDACIERLVHIGLATRTTDGFESQFSFFHPSHHIPPTVATNDHNISPVESKCFVQRSMQNVQYINHNGGGCCKYCCKYITKFDLGNRVHVKVKQDGSFVRSKEFLFNTKVTTSHMAQHKIVKKKQDKFANRSHY